jgi:hypothetical protein
MWLIIAIAVLLLISFPLYLLGRIAETRRRKQFFSLLELALSFVALILASKIDFEWFTAVMGFYILFPGVSDLIARPILRRRVKAPCVSVKSLSHNYISIVFVSVLGLLLLLYWLIKEIETFRSFGIVVFLGLLTVSLIISQVLNLRVRIEICGNGVRLNGRLNSWDEYKWFSWAPETEDCVELWLGTKSFLPLTGSIGLAVPPESREAVHQWLEANLPELSPVRIDA